MFRDSDLLRRKAHLKGIGVMPLVVGLHVALEGVLQGSKRTCHDIVNAASGG